MTAYDLREVCDDATAWCAALELTPEIGMMAERAKGLP
jgi:hypothetical protein